MGRNDSYIYIYIYILIIHWITIVITVLTAKVLHKTCFRDLY